jgi:hypothetical protein
VPGATSVSPSDDLAKQISNRLLARYGPDLVIVQGRNQALSRRSPWRAENSVSRPKRIWPDRRGLGNVAGPACNRDLVEAWYLHRKIARFLLSYLSPSVSMSDVKKPVARLRNLTLILDRVSLPMEARVCVGRGKQA